jgi:uncharacterized protein YrzB (UPF0473 family)
MAENEKMERLVLEDEEGNEEQFTIIDIIDVDNKTYALLHPEDGEEDDVVVYAVEDENFRPLEEDELQEAIDAFEKTGEYEIFDAGE